MNHHERSNYANAVALLIEIERMRNAHRRAQMFRALRIGFVVVYVALVLFMVFTSPAKADTLTIARPWSADVFSCDAILVEGGSTFGQVTAQCSAWDHYHDSDHLLSSGFDEQPWGAWSWQVLGTVPATGYGCHLLHQSASAVTMQCGQGGIR